MKTNLYDQPFSKEKNEEMYNQLDPEVRDLFGREYFEKNLESFRYFLFATPLASFVLISSIFSLFFFRKLVNDVGGDPERVVDGMETAVCSLYPPSRMAIG